jgi:hypothetical protein
MRVVALLFGLLGVIGSAFVGVKWMNDPAVTGKAAELNKELYPKVKDLPPNPLTDPIIEAYRRGRTYMALLGCAALGAIACFVVAMRKGVIAGALFLGAFAIPMALYQKPQLAVFTGAFVIAGLLSFFVKSPTPYKAPRPGPGISEDDDLVG